METKNLSVEVKDAAEGKVGAVFVTFGVKDHDGDIIEAGAIGDQKVRVSSFGHASWGGALPVGVGTVTEKGDEAIAELEFFMESTVGRDHYETVKGLGDLGEWSFGFDILDESAPSEEQRQAGVSRILKKLRVHEVSPVLKGAGINTRTTDVKCDSCAAKGAKAEDDKVDDVENIETETPEDEVEEIIEGELEAKGEDAELRDLIAKAEGRSILLDREREGW